jgi:hypothetical protein
MQTFQIGYKDVFGSSLTHDLKENGSQMQVTQENKQGIFLNTGRIYFLFNTPTKCTLSIKF